MLPTFLQLRQPFERVWRVLLFAGLVGDFGLAGFLCLAQPRQSSITAPPFPIAFRPGESATLSSEKSGSSPSLWRSFPSHWVWQEDASVKPSVRRGVLTPDATLPAGAVHAIRWSDDTGAAPIRLVYLDDLPTRPWDSSASPPVLTWPCAVDGVARDGSSLVFALDVRKGEEVSIEIIARRLGSEMDPWLRVEDAQGKVLLDVDDVPSWEADAGGTLKAPRTGRYFIHVRDASFGGGPSFFFRMRVGRFPLVTALYPPAAFAAAGHDYEVWAVGDVPVKAVQVVQKELPGLGSASFSALEIVDRSGRALLSIPRIDAAPILEHEPNEHPPQVVNWKATRWLAGRLRKPGDVDRFAFRAAAGEKWRFKSRTRSVGSPCDLFMSLEAGPGQKAPQAAHASRDEASLTHTFASETEAVLRVEELTRRGSPSFLYLIEAELLDSSVSLELGTNTYGLKAGEEIAIKIKLVREGFAGPVSLLFEPPMEGVEGQSLTIPGTSNEGVFKLRPRSEPKGERLTVARVKGVLDGTSRTTYASTLPALRERFPLMRHPPPMLDGWVFFSRNSTVKAKSE
ncbi:MAG: hypothetical protein FJ404_17920 [Verrucomicrobia bacterium]|nr:hypothetical protein [Verrucomicrobiota bacterium]